MTDAIGSYVFDVKACQFPTAEESYWWASEILIA
jgi:hypothetical protein